MSISNHVLKNGTKIGTATVISNDLRSKGSAVPGRVLNSISSVTMHNSGLVDVKANNFHRSLKNQNALSNGRQASWTFTVDDIEIYQETKINWETWHAGNSTGNKNSISIEMCMWSDKEKQRKTYENAAALVAMLLKHYNLDLDDVKQHYDWSKKNCPQYLREGKHGYNWNWFKERVKAHLSGNATSTASTTTSSSFKSYVVKIDTDSLNVRKGPGTSYAIATTVKKGQAYTIVEEKNGLGRLKSGAGWISLAYTKKA